MPNEQTQTTEGLGGARVTQFSIFLPNKVGALLHIVRLLNEHHVDVLAVIKNTYVCYLISKYILL